MTPTVSGIAKVGLTLTATPGTSAASGVTSTYQWQRSSDSSTWSNISGATAANYTAVSADGAKYLRVVQTVSDGTVSASGESSPTSLVLEPVPSASLKLYYDASNPSSYPGSGSTINDLSTGGHTGTMNGTAGYTSPNFTFSGGSNGASYTSVGGDLSGFSTGLTVSIEGTLGAIDNYERFIDVGNVAANSNGLYGSGDGFLAGRYWTTNEVLFEVYNNGTSAGQCRSSGAAADTSYARWTFSVSSTGLCRIFKNGVALQTNLNGGTNSSTGTQITAPSNASHTYNYIGRSHWTGDAELNGGIRWIKVYNTALSTAQIADELTGTVTFNANGGSGSMSSPQSSSSTTALNANGFNRAGYTFTGWNTKGDGSGTNYANSAYYSFSDDIMLYAKWSLNAVTPTITGTAAVGQTLTATPGASSATGVTSAYQWQRSSDGNNWTNISGETGTSYTVTTADTNKFLRFQQTLNDGSQTATGSSASTAKVPNSESVTLTATASGWVSSTNTSVALGWNTPTAYNSATVTDYIIEYSTNGTSGWTAITHTASTATNFLITGLSQGQTYYYRVTPVLSSGTGATSAVASTITRTTTTALTVSASPSSNVVTTGGAIAVSAANTTGNISASDLQTLLAAGDVILAADTVTVSSALSWSANTKLKLGNSLTSTVAINADITATGNTAGLAISPAACAFSSAGTYTGCYSLDVKNGANIRLTGSSSSVTIGGVSYAIVNTKAGLTSFNAAGNASAKWVIADDIDLSGSTYTSQVLGFGGNNFSGTLDGFGNRVRNLTGTTSSSLGLFNVLAASTVRNLGITEVAFTINPPGTNNATAAGALASFVGGAAVVDQVWSTGWMKTVSGNYGAYSLGGLVGNAYSGSLNLTRSWSSVNLDTSLTGTVSQPISGASTTGPCLALGGLVASAVSAWCQASGTNSGSLRLEQVYTTGSIKRGTDTSWRGVGGIIGLTYSSASHTVTDAFSWGRITTTDNFQNIGGILGVATNTTLTRTYTSHSSCVDNVAFTGCTSGVLPGTTGTYSSSAWGSTNGTTLTNLTAAVRPLYVQPVTPTNGAYGTVGYKIVDGTGNDYTAALASYNLSVSGTATWDTISANSAPSVTPYSVLYVSGLTLGGGAAASYSLNPWTSATSITISKTTQTVTWSPTTTIPFGSGTATPSSLASANTTVTYAVTSAGTSGCSVNASTGAISYSAAGSCTVKASAANAGDYLAAEKSVTFTIDSPAEAPTSVAVTGAGQTTAVVGWIAPTVNATTAISGYTVMRSTNSDMSGATAFSTGSARTWFQLTGLSANTTYYVTVTPTGSTLSGAAWTGTTSAVASGATKASTTTLTIVSTAGDVAGTNFVSTGGAFAAASTSASINASDVQTALAAGDVILAADTVTVNAPLNWSANTVLTVGNGTASTIAINATLTAGGNTAGVRLAGASYALSTKTGVRIALTGSAPTLSIGGTNYTLVKSLTDLANVSASGTFALAQPLSYTSSITTSPINLTFAGTFDGLGNTVSNMSLTASSNGNYGLFKELGGATVRNLGVTNVKMTSTGAIDHRMGALAGNGSTAGTNTVTQVWATGQIKQTNTSARVEAGGLFGGATAGTLNLTKAWSSVAVSTDAYVVASGGIIGANVSGYQGGANSGTTLTVSESYSTGNILRSGPSSMTWYGNGGIIGVAYGVATTISNTFSWGNINSTGTNAGTSTGGIVGVASGTNVKVSSSYTVNAICAPGADVTGGCLTRQTAGSPVTGYSTGLWSTANGASLMNLPLPTKLLYVQTLFSGTTGSYADLSYKIVDSTGVEQSPTNLSAIGVVVGGTVAYSIASNVARGTYSVNYDSGLTLSGSSASVYSLQPWTTATSVTITRLAQTVSWSPTTALLRTDTGLTFAAATTSGDGALSYTVTSAGTTGCTVDSATRVLNFTAEGSCTISAKAAQTTGYTEATLSQTFVISTAPPLAPTGLVVTAGSVSGQLGLSWAAPSTSTTGGTIASYELDVSTDGTNFTSVATGITSASYTATGLSNGLGYTYRVRAVNNLSQTSPWLTASTSTKPYYKPISLTAPALTGSAVGGLTLTTGVGDWDDNGNALTGTAYKWQISTDGLTGWADISGATSSTYTVLASQAGKYLRSVVTKSNAAGDTSQESLATAAVQSGLASAPQTLIVTRGNEQLNVTWAAPSALNGGTISAYKVQYRSLNGSWTTASASISDSATSYTITGLTNGTEYDVRIYAVTAAGESPATTTTQTVTPANAPSNTAIPTLSGMEAVGRQLTATTGDWSANGNTITGYSYEWQSSADGSTGWSAIAGATSSTFTPTVTEAGLYLRVVVGAINDVGTTTEPSLATDDAVRSGLASAPTSLSSTASNGQLVLSWTAPTTLNGGTILDYEVQYKKSSDSSWTSAFVGSDTASITLTGLSNATAYDWKVAAVTAAGAGTVASYSSDLDSTPFTTPSNSAIPVLSGTPAVARSLNATNGTWSANGRTVTYSYQWQVSANGSTDWASVASGGTSANYTVAAADSGKYLRVKVTATNDAGSVSEFSAETTAVESGLAGAVGNLAASRGDTEIAVSWDAPTALNGASAITAYRVQYSSDGSSWSTASSAVSSSATSYTITGLTNGTAYQVQVDAVTAAGNGAVASPVSATPSGIPINTAAPTISGTVTVGQTLTVNTGTWNENGDTATFSYQWQTSATGTGGWSDLSGATAATYTLAPGDANQYLRALVVATNVAGSSSAEPTAATTSVLGAPTNTTAPSVSALDGGTGGVGTRLSSTLGDWDDYGLGIIEQNFQWQRSSDGTSWSDITGATNSWYALATADAGNFVRVKVSVASVGGIGTATTRYTGSETDGSIGSGLATAPRSLSATASANMIIFEWQAPSSVNGGALENYVIQHSANGTDWTTAIDNLSGQQTIYFMTGLTNGVEYQIRIFGQSAAGDGSIATLAGSANTTPYGAPISTAVPTITGSLAVGETLTAVSGTWNANGRAITSTSYRWFTTTDGVNYTFVGNGSTYTVQASDLDTSIHVTERADNPGGSSEATSADSAAIENGLSEAPASFTVSYTPVKFALSWAAPTDLNGASAITGYRVQYSTNGSDWTTATSSLAASATGYDLTNLTVGSNYFVRVSALTLGGIGSAAQTPNAVLYGAKPTASVAPSLSGTTSVLSTLSATDGTWSGNGASITATDYQWQRSGDGSTGWSNIDGATSDSYALTATDAHQYIRVIVTKTNLIGSTAVESQASAQIGAGPASAPRSLTLTRTDHGLTLNWLVPSALNGGTLADYTIEISDDNGQSWNTVNHTASTATTISIGDLTEGSSYRVRVRAETEVSGDWVTSADTTAIGAPTYDTTPAVSGTPMLGQVLTATTGTWSNHGASITGYSYQWQRSADGSSNWADVVGATSSTMTIATANVYYRVLVRATNEAGTSVSSAASLSTPFVVSQKAAAPSGLTVTPADESLLISWVAPTQLGGGTISNYAVFYSLNGSDWTSLNRTSNTSTTAIIGGLTNGTAYHVKVAAETTVQGYFVFTPTPVIPFGAPINTALPLVTGTAKFDSTIYAGSDSWADNGGTLGAKTYQWQSTTDNGANWYDIAGATSSSYRIGSYVGSKLRVSVTQTNQEGLSTTAFSAATAQVNAIAAGSPASVSITPGDQQMTISWLDPTSWGGSILTRYLVEYSDDDGENWMTVSRTNQTARTETITGLTNGTHYLVRVKTITAVDGNFAFASAVPFGLPISSTLPTISGTSEFDQTLIAANGSWDSNGSSITATNYQWQYSADSGSSWRDIPSATNQSYTLGLYVGKLVRVKITSTNTAGDTAAYSLPTSVVAPAAPNAPTSLTTVAGDGELRLSWSVPSYVGGASITDYDVEYSVNASDWFRATRSSSDLTEQTITGLSNATAYYVRVRGLNGAEGAWATSANRTTPFGAPISTALPVVSGNVTYDQQLSATVGSWNTNGSPLTSTSYQWQYSSDNGNSWQAIQNATDSNYTIGDHVGHLIRVRVTVANLRGSTAHYSAPSAAVLAAPAEAPTELSAEASDGQLTLTWRTPSYLGGSPIIDYQIEYASAPGDWQRVSRTASPTTSQVITGLINGTDYDIRIRAMNGVDGIWQTVSAAGRPFGLPQTAAANTQPTVSGTAKYNDTLNVANTAWNANGSPITQTSFRWQVETSGTWTDINGASATSYRITGFIGKRVRAVVTVTNSAGSVELASLPTTAIIPAAAGSPTAITATLGDQSATLSWQAPTNTGGAPISDYLVYISTDGGTWQQINRAPSTETSMRVTGLTNGDPYYIQIRAFNGQNGNLGFLSSPIISRGLPIVTTTPEITGVAQFNGQISVDDGQWNENGDSIDRFGYQWQYSSDNGQSWSNIQGATQSTYTVGLFVGSKLRAVVRATNDAGITSEYTAATSTVTAIPAATPVITSQSVSNGSIRVGWTPPAHSGGETLAGYTLQYSTDRANWTTLSYSATDTAATISGLSNGTGYSVRVRAETSQSGEWSPIAGPFTPVAPPRPVILTPAPTQPATTSSDTVAPLLTSVMPRTLTTTSITSLTGPSQVTVTSDGRIELQPAQTVALIDGQPVQAAVSVSGAQVTVETESTSMAIDFGTSAVSASSSTVLQGSEIAFNGEGFAAGSPVVTWIQSDPIKIGTSNVSHDGAVDDTVTIPETIVPGQHTIQVNGLDTQGRVVSLIYGVEVQSVDPPQPATASPLNWQLLFGLLIAVLIALLAVFAIVVLRRRSR